MNADIAQHRLELESLCRHFRVRRLELFGSAARGVGFSAISSDYDLLVDFENADAPDAAKRYFGLLHAFEDLFGRHIDLVDASAIANPYFLQHVNQSKELLYAA